TVRMLLVPARYAPDRNARADVVRRMLERIRALPQVTAAASIHFLPLSGMDAGFSVISDGYFHTMGIPLIAGREFGSGDRPGSTPVAVINRTAARILYGDENPIGKQLAVEWDGPPQAEIVGVAADSRFDEMKALPEPYVYLPNAQHPSLWCGLVIRTTGNPTAVIAAVRDAIRAADPQQGVMETSTMEQRITDSIAQPRLQTVLMAAFGFLALVLASLGIYGVLAYA